MPSFQRVVYRGIYDGVDLWFRESEATLEYDLVLAPDVDLSVLKIRCEGADAVRLAVEILNLMESETNPPAKD